MRSTSISGMVVIWGIIGSVCSGTPVPCQEGGRVPLNRMESGRIARMQRPGQLRIGKQCRVITEGEGKTRCEGIAAESLKGVYPDRFVLVRPDLSGWQGQIVYLDFDGERDVTYDGPVTVGPFDIPAFQAPGALAGQERTIVNRILSSLSNASTGTGISFTTTVPPAGAEYSTIYIGGNGSAFAQYGSFLGLAEQVDIGNQNRGDNAFVFADRLSLAADCATVYADTLADLIVHEVRHLLGYRHVGDGVAGETSGYLECVAATMVTTINGATPSSWDETANRFDKSTRYEGGIELAHSIYSSKPTYTFHMPRPVIAPGRQLESITVTIYGRGPYLVSCPTVYIGGTNRGTLRQGEGSNIYTFTGDDARNVVSTSADGRGSDLHVTIEATSGNYDLRDISINYTYAGIGDEELARVCQVVSGKSIMDEFLEQHVAYWDSAGMVLDEVGKAIQREWADAAVSVPFGAVPGFYGQAIGWLAQETVFDEYIRPRLPEVFSYNGKEKSLKAISLFVDALQYVEAVKTDSETAIDAFAALVDVYYDALKDGNILGDEVKNVNANIRAVTSSLDRFWQEDEGTICYLIATMSLSSGSDDDKQEITRGYRDIAAPVAYVDIGSECHVNLAQSYMHEFAQALSAQALPTTITVESLVLSVDVADPYENLQLSGSARYDTGRFVSAGTAVVNVQDGLQYTAPVVDGYFSAYVVAPGNPSGGTVVKIVSAVVGDGSLPVSEPARASLTVRGQGSSEGFSFNEALTCRDAEGVEPWGYIDPTEVFGDWDDKVTCWFELGDVYGAHTAEVRWYRPDNSYWGGSTINIPDAEDSGYECWSTYRAYTYIDLVKYPSAKNTPGEWRVEVYVDGVRHASKAFFMRYTIIEHRMCKEVDEVDPWMYHQPTNTFCQTDERAVTWCQMKNVAQGMSVRWVAYEPTGVPYDEWYWDIIDPVYKGFGYYDSYRLYGYLPIAQTNAAQKCGQWRIEVYVDDLFGNWNLVYTDYFRLLESPIQAPTVDMALSCDEPYPGQGVSLSLSASDNTYLKRVEVYASDPIQPVSVWDDLLVSSLSKTVDLGAFSACQIVPYWVLAEDTSGNVTVTRRQSFTVICAPQVITDPPGWVGEDRAELRGTLQDDGGTACYCGFLYGKLSEPQEDWQYKLCPGTYGTGDSFKLTVWDVQPSAMSYGYYAWAHNDSGSDLGEPPQVFGQGNRVDFEEFTGMDLMYAIPGVPPVPASAQLHDQLLSTYGLVFTSGSPYVTVIDYYRCIPSGTKGIQGSTPDGKWSVSSANPIVISFFKPGDSSVPAGTDFVSVQGDLCGDGNDITLDAYDVNGNLVASSTGPDSGGILRVATTTKIIHKVKLLGHPYDYEGVVWDNLTFNTPVELSGH